MKEVHDILQKDESKAQAQIKLYASTVTEMVLHKADLSNIAELVRDIGYYVAGFISRSVKKVGSNSDIKMEIEGIIPEDCQSFVDEISWPREAL